MQKRFQASDVYAGDNKVKKLFDSPSGKDYLAILINKVFDLDVLVKSIDLKELHPEIGINSNIVNSEVDAIFETDNIYCNIEVNFASSKSLHNKNFVYVCQLLLRQAGNSEAQKNTFKKIYQLNLNNFDMPGINKTVAISKLLEKDTLIEMHPYIEIADVSIAKVSRMSYNEVIKDKGSIEYYLYLLVNNNKMNLETLYGDDRIMKQVYEDAKKLTRNFDEILFYNKEELYNQVSFEKGEEKGRFDEKKSIAINMLENNMDISLISKITGFSIEEIKTIQKELN